MLTNTHSRGEVLKLNNYRGKPRWCDAWNSMSTPLHRTLPQQSLAEVQTNVELWSSARDVMQSAATGFQFPARRCVARDWKSDFSSLRRGDCRF